MKPTLDHTQRLNLQAIWSIQDRIALDAGEERAVELKREVVAGQERVIWNPALWLPPRDFEFTDAEVARINAALQTWDSYGVSANRRWLEPLLDAFATSRPIT
jgi:hypothetical protein